MANSFVRMKIVLIVVVSLTIFTTSVARAADDPRFFGKYCGQHEERYDVPVCIPFIPFACWRESRHLRLNVEATVNYIQTPEGDGLLTGDVNATGDGHNVNAILTGAVTGHGRAQGTVLIPEVRQTYGSVRLADDGHTLTVHGNAYTIDLSKIRCGNNPPIVLIRSSATRFPWGGNHQLYAQARDNEDETLDRRRMTWRSNRDRDWQQHGLTARLNDLSPGHHTLSFTAVDSGGLSSTARRDIEIANNAPNVSIIMPADGSHFYESQLIMVSGWATDAEAGNLTAREGALSWHVDGRQLASGTPASLSLAAGTHTLTLQATDGIATGSDSIRLHVDPATGRNLAPTVSIRQPARYQVVGNGASDCIALEVGSAHDPEDGELFGDSIIWRDQIVGAAVAREITFRGRRGLECGLTAGDTDTKHIISVTAVDSAGVASQPATQEIYVIPITGGPY